MRPDIIGRIKTDVWYFEIRATFMPTGPTTDFENIFLVLRPSSLLHRIQTFFERNSDRGGNAPSAFVENSSSFRSIVAESLTLLHLMPAPLLLFISAPLFPPLSSLILTLASFRRDLLRHFFPSFVAESLRSSFVSFSLFLSSYLSRRVSFEFSSSCFEIPLEKWSARMISSKG